jgi:hypothetical protein
VRVERNHEWFRCEGEKEDGKLKVKKDELLNPRTLRSPDPQLSRSAHQIVLVLSTTKTMSRHTHTGFTMKEFVSPENWVAQRAGVEPAASCQ